MTGTVAILNVAAGDTKLTFDPSNPAEVKRSAAIVMDMIRRGFVLLVEVGRDEKGPTYRRVHDFDESTAEYIIAGSAMPQEEAPTNDQKPASPPRRRSQAKAGKRQRTERVSATKTNVVAVSRTAGG